jgi:hypothetical protein
VVTTTRNLDLEYQAWNFPACKKMNPQILALNEEQIADLRMEAYIVSRWMLLQ